MKRTFFFFLLLKITSLCFSQSNPVQLPQVIPPSPEASAIAKGGQLSVGLFTGAANASISFYEIKLRGMSLPIGLNYSTNGTKVDEIPSRTGLNWVLSAAGSINRIVHGKPDDKSVRTLPPTGNPTELQLEAYYNSIADTYNPADNEPDEFVITAPGLSARFILDFDINNNIYIPVFIPHSNLKVTFTGGTNGSLPYEEFIVTNTEGVKYYFGGPGAIETTLSHNMTGKYIVHQQIRTAFFLKKIELPEGEIIQYNYSSVNFSTQTGISQGVKRGTLGNLTRPCGPNGYTPCQGPYPDAASFIERIAEVSYNTVYLTQITGPNFLNIGFTYENRPDGSGDKRLKEVNVATADFSRKFRLLYTDPYTVNYNKRFFLSAVQAIQPAQGIAPPDTLQYLLEYEDISALPSRLSFSQDYLGFFNGLANLYFLPAIPNEDWGAYATANRSFRGDMAVKGTLRKITYPTGGYEEFVYEPNTVSKWQAPGGPGSMVTKTISGSGNSVPSDPTGNWIIVEHNSEPFTVLQTHTANVFMQIFSNPGCTACSPPPPNTVNIAWIEVVNTATNTVEWSNLMREHTSITLPCQLTANTTYKLRLRIRGLPNAGYVAIEYNKDPPGGTGVWENVEAGGVRVKEIRTYEPVSNKTNTQYYSYARLADLSKSSGKTIFMPDFMENTNQRQDCYPGVPLPQLSTTCDYTTLSSNSAMPLYMFDNNHMGYEYVVEADHPVRFNGSIEHKFSVYPIFNRTVVLGEEIKSLPSNTVATTNGSEITTKYFNAAGNLIKETNSNYDFHPGYSNQISCVAVRKRYDFPNNNGERLHPFDVTKYDYISYWVEMSGITTTEYDANNKMLTSNTTFYYGNTSNVQPIKKETTNSMGQVQSTEYKYPTDFPSVQPYTDMVAKNIISPVVEQKEKNVTLNKELSLLKNNYISLGGSLFRPSTIQRSLLGQPLEIEATFNQYDNKGNTLQVTGKDGVPVSYVWSYNQVYPVAKITGKAYNDAVAQSGINLTLLNSSIQEDEVTAQTELNKLRTLNAALVSTYLHYPYNGIKRETNPAGININYKYDNIGRLILVSDHTGRVLKKICYNYAGRPENCATGCTNTLPNWQNTATPLRCEQNASGQNTGYQEQEQTDINNCSSTYQQTRWVQAGYNITACPLTTFVSLTSTNFVGAGYIAQYTHNITGQVYTFNVSSAAGLQTLGTLAAGTYTLYIYKPTSTWSAIFSSGCNGQTIEGVSATFYNVNVSAATCNSILIDTF